MDINFSRYECPVCNGTKEFSFGKFFKIGCIYCDRRGYIDFRNYFSMQQTMVLVEFNDLLITHENVEPHPKYIKWVFDQTKGTIIHNELGPLNVNKYGYVVDSPQIEYYYVWGRKYLHRSQFLKQIGRPDEEVALAMLEE